MRKKTTTSSAVKNTIRLLTYTPKKTSLLIFLNKTCFNGMYRENRSGQFNVPFGKHSNPTICDETNLSAVSKKLSNTVLTSSSYKDAVKSAGYGDFVYFDPPYYPLSPTSSFTSYHADDFNKQDQEELRDLFIELSKRGCFVMLSYSDTPFINELYSGLKSVANNIKRLFAPKFNYATNF
jgi:DNA adenine methylase